jgi:Tfp pilus assembly protein PilF
VDYLTLCLKHDHRHYEAHFNLANIYSEAGNIALAKFHYQIAIKLEPGFSNSYFNLALLLVVNREYEEAIKKLKNYLQLVPESEHVPALELIEKLSDLK